MVPNTHDTVTRTHPRRSQRTGQAPTYLQDYHCSLISSYQLLTSSCRYPISQVLSYSSLSPKQEAFSLAILIIPEPTSYAKAVKDANWRRAIEAELTALA